MNPNDPNVAMMELVADRLGSALREEFVFLGGAVTGLLITDPGQPAIRPTEDVDLIVHAAVRADYQRVEDALRQRGFVHDLSIDAPICRWRVGGVAVDIMPTLEEILGFTNRWYPLALSSAVPSPLPSGTTIRLVAPPAFVATKLVAFIDRGKADYLFSHDLNDLIAVIDGRDELHAECSRSESALRRFLSKQIRCLLDTRAFHDALPGHLPGDAASQARLPALLMKLKRIAELDASD